MTSVGRSVRWGDARGAARAWAHRRVCGACPGSHCRPACHSVIGDVAAATMARGQMAPSAPALAAHRCAAPAMAHTPAPAPRAAPCACRLAGPRPGRAGSGRGRPRALQLLQGRDAHAQAGLQAALSAAAVHVPARQARLAGRLHAGQPQVWVRLSLSLQSQCAGAKRALRWPPQARPWWGHASTSPQPRRRHRNGALAAGASAAPHARPHPHPLVVQVGGHGGVWLPARALHLWRV